MMLTELEWTHPVHGIVTESLCPNHELAALASLLKFGIKYTTLPTSDRECHRCHEELRWNNRITPTLGIHRK